MNRNIDAITGATVELEPLYVFKDFPANMLADGSVDSRNDAKFDMRIGISPLSGCIQLMELLPEDMVYVDTHSNAVGSTWKQQHELLAKIIEKQNPQKILEIGGALVF